MEHIIRTRTTVALVALFLITVVPLVFGTHVEALGINIGAFAAIMITGLFWAVVIAGGVWLFVNIAGSPTVKRLGSQDEAISLLRQRFAKGEINRAEYFQMKQDLECGS